MNKEYSRVVSALTLFFANPTDKLQAIVLSKGGWEGWLQCELWNVLNDGFVVDDYQYEGKSYMREERYLDGTTFCDLVDDDRNFWIELKAYGIFRDLNDFINKFKDDIQKIGRIYVPAIAVVVIPKIYEKESMFEDIKPIMLYGMTRLQYL